MPVSSLRRALLAPLALVGLSLQADGPQGGPSTTLPSASQHIKLRSGSVDAVSGALHLSIPIGPRLPGRIPLGFNWTYNSMEEVNLRGGGNYRPVIWNLDPTNRLARVVLVQGQTYAFYYQAAPADPTMLTNVVTLQKWATDRGVDVGLSKAQADWSAAAASAQSSGAYMDPLSPTWTASAIANSDGTKFLIKGGWQATYHDDTKAGTPVAYPVTFQERTIIIDGPNAIWLDSTGVSHFTNRFGDHVSVAETKSSLTDVLGTSSQSLDWLAQAIQIQNEVTKERLILSIALNGPDMAQDKWHVQCPATLKVTHDHTLTGQEGELPTVTVQGWFAQRAVYLRTGGRDCQTGEIIPTSAALQAALNNLPPPPEPAPNLYVPLFRPTTITTTPSGGAPQVLTFSWGTTDPSVSTAPQNFPTSITYPNGVMEAFTVAPTMFPNMASLSYDFCSGLWQGFHFRMGRKYPVRDSAGGWLGGGGFTSPFVEINRGGYGLQWVKTTGPGVDQAIQLLPVSPYLANPNDVDDNGVYQGLPTEYRHLTNILYYSASNPGAGTPFQAVQLTHPNINPATDNAGYLTATSAVLKAVVHVGQGVQTAAPTPDPAKILSTTLYDGWDLRSWANPNGALGTALPVNPVALRTRVFTTNLPMKTTVAGLTSDQRDDRGPIHTEEYTDVPVGAVPDIDPTTGGAWVSAVTAPVTPTQVQRTGQITRAFKSDLAILPTKTDQKTLSGSALPLFRAVTGGSVDFGITTMDDPDGQGLVAAVTGTRGDYTAKEARTFYSDGTRELPLPLKVIKTLTLKGAAIPVDPLNPGNAVQAGHEYQYDTTAQHWLSAERDLTDNRWTSYVRDNQGKVTQTTDPLGVITMSTYDAWGRPLTSTRQAKGTVGAASILYAYADDGSWKYENVSTKAGMITHKTFFDGAGRVIKTQTLDGAWAEMDFQTFGYDGFGRKIWQSPLLKHGQANYGFQTWVYDAFGRITDTYDRIPDPVNAPTTGGRLRTHTVLQPTYQTMTFEGQAITGTWMGVQDDRGFTHYTCSDLLGQKVAEANLVDQTNQVYQITKYSYDKDGHLLGTQQGNQQRSYLYNDMGWMTSRTEPEEGTTFYDTFTLNGTPLYTKMTGRDGTALIETKFTQLNAWGMPTVVTATVTTGAGVESTVSRTLTFDGITHLLTDLAETQSIAGIAGQTLSEHYGYDDLFRLNSKTVSDGVLSFSVSRILDDAGNETSLTLPAAGGRGQEVIATNYDFQLRPKQVFLGTASRGLMDYGDSTITGSAVTTVLTYGNGATTKQVVDKGDLVRTEHAAPFAMDRTVGYLETNPLTWSTGGLLVGRGSDTFEYDPLRRLAHAKTTGIQGETAEQWFVYDRYGNRVQSDYLFNGGSANVTKPSELLAYRAVYGDSNDLPLSLTSIQTPGTAQGVLGQGASGAALSTDRVYDKMGRITSVTAVPGQTSEATSWVYDPSGRIVQETVGGATSTFLLDAEGLRFRKQRPGGALEYTLYGFHREPLRQFIQPASTGTVGTSSFASTSTRTSSKTTSMASIGGGGGGDGGTDPALPGVAIVTPSAGATLASGQSVTFTGTSSVSSGVSYQWNFGDGSVVNGASVTHAYANSGTYTVTLSAWALNYSNGTKTITVTVIAPPTVTANASPSSITAGNATTLNWTTSNATSVTIDQGVGSVATNGSRSVSPLSTTTYTVTATNAAASRTATVVVTVNAPPPPAINSFNASKRAVDYGQSVTLTWSASNASTYTINGVTVTGGSATFTPNQTTTYTLTARGVTGLTATQSLDVILQPAAVSSFTTSSLNIAPGASVTLNWATVGAQSVTLNGASVSVSGSQTLTPATTSTYTLVAQNADGPCQKNLTVVVQGTQSLLWRKTVVYGFGQVLSEETADNGTVYVQSDFVGSPNLLSDATGRVVGRSKNLPFGERFGSTGVQSIRRFTNHEDQPGSVIYMQARTYLPVYGKFAQVDPAYDQIKDNPESWNLYNYVTNNPVTKTDPDGRMYRENLEPSKEYNPGNYGAGFYFSFSGGIWSDPAEAAFQFYGEIAAGWTIPGVTDRPNLSPQGGAGITTQELKPGVSAQPGDGGYTGTGGANADVSNAVRWRQTPDGSFGAGSTTPGDGKGIVTTAITGTLPPDEFASKERDKAATAVTVAGIGTAVAKPVVGNASLGTNLKLYKSGWTGGSRARITTFKLAEVAEGGGEALFGLGVFIDLYRLGTGDINGLEFGANTAAGAAGLVAPPVPIIYFGGQVLLDGNRSPDVRDHYVRGVGFRP